jgi:hypothetical protein
VPKGFIEVHDVTDASGKSGRLSTDDTIAGYFPSVGAVDGSRIVMKYTGDVIDVKETVEEIDRLIDEANQ